MPHSQGLSNIPYPESNQHNSLIETYFFQIHSIISSYLRLSLPKRVSPLGLPVKILKTLLPSPILPT